MSKHITVRGSFTHATRGFRRYIRLFAVVALGTLCVLVAVRLFGDAHRGMHSLPWGGWHLSVVLGMLAVGGGRGGVDRGGSLFDSALTERLSQCGRWKLDLMDGSFAWSPGCASLFGQTTLVRNLTRGDLLGLFAPESRRAAEAALEKAATTPGESFRLDLHVLASDGTRFWVLFAGESDEEEGRATCIHGIFQNISNRIEADHVARRTETDLRAILDRAPDIIFATNTSGAVLFANQACLTGLGLSLDQLTGACFHHWLHPHDRDAALLALTKGLPATARLGSAARGWTCHELLQSSYLASDGTRTAIVIARDTTTSQRSTEARVRRALQEAAVKRADTIVTLAGGVAHNFNNLLTGISGFQELAAGALPSEHPAWKFLLESGVGVKRAKALVSGLLAFSNRDEILSVPSDLGELIGAAVTNFARGCPATVTLTPIIEPGLPRVCCDPERFKAVVEELSLNAVQSFPNKIGTVSLLLHRVEVTPALSAAEPRLRSVHTVRLTIRDTGSGIHPDALPYVFDPFFTTKPVGQGLGLGLARVYGFVEGVRGVISAESVEGVGTCMHLYFPEVREPLLPAGGASGERVPAGHGQMVLLVDDEPVVLDVTSRYLQRLGYQVTSFQRAGDALAAFQLRPQRYDVVLSDVAMPDMDGLAMVAAMRRHREDFAVVFMAGGQAPAGARYFLPKPFDIPTMAAVLHRALSARGGKVA